MDLDLTMRHVLQVSENRLLSLPAEIGRLTQLEGLSVRNSNWLVRSLNKSVL
jgi:hypothetical protein